MRWLPVCLSVAIACGAAVGIAWTPSRTGLLTALCVASVSAGVAARHRATGLLLASTLTGFVCGVAALAAHDERDAQAPPIRAALSGIGHDTVQVTGRLTEDATPGANGVGLRVAIQTLDDQPHAGPAEAAISVVGELAPALAVQWRRGRQMRLPARLREPARYLDAGVPDHRLGLARRGLVLVGTVKSGALVRVEARGSWWDEWSAVLRARVRDVFRRRIGVWDPTAAAIATAILIGDRGGLDPALVDRLQAAGTYHVIAISGGNIAVLAAVLLLLARVLQLPSRVASCGAALLLAAHANLVGAGASVVRATTMAVAVLGLRALDQRAWTVNTLAAAAGLMLVVGPLALVDPGFLLSVGATAAIVLLAQRLTPVASSALVRAVATLIAASLATELVLLPVSASLFNRVTVAGLVLNLAAVPLMAVVQIGGLAAVALDPTIPPLSQAAAVLVAVAARGMVESSRLIEWWPWLVRRVPPPVAWASVLYACGLAVSCATPWLLWLPGRRRVGARRVAVCAAVFAGVWILAAPDTWRWPWRLDGWLRIVALDVGQGDATLIEWPGGQRWLVDAGGLAGTSAFDIGARVVTPALWARRVGRLDTLVLTHGDPDHIGGAAAVISDFQPAAIWEGVPVAHHEGLTRLRGLASLQGSRWVDARAGDAFTLGGVAVRVWHPSAPDWARQKVRNDDSVVLELRFGRVSIVLPGDIGAAVERDLARQLPPAPFRVLKAAHHGSATSSSDAFLDALKPSIALISCGRDNRFGHPAPAVLARYAARGTTVFRTDQDGDVVIETDGTAVRVHTFTGRTYVTAK
jgi:competence protein ComEC